MPPLSINQSELAILADVVIESIEEVALVWQAGVPAGNP